MGHRLLGNNCLIKVLFNALIIITVGTTIALIECSNNFPAGQAEDRVLAASIASLVCIQLGVESEGFFKVLKPILTMIIQDPTASIGARASVSITFFRLNPETISWLI